MGRALLAGAIIFAGSYAALSLVELIIHKLTKNSDKSYKKGVLVFSALFGLYAFASTFGI